LDTQLRLPFGYSYYLFPISLGLILISHYLGSQALILLGLFFPLISYWPPGFMVLQALITDFIKASSPFGVVGPIPIWQKFYDLVDLYFH